MDAWKDENEELADLLQKASLGDTGAFEAFYDRTAPRLLAEVRSLVPDEHADDVLTQTFVLAWQTVATRDRRRPELWLQAIARTCALAHMCNGDGNGSGRACPGDIDPQAAGPREKTGQRLSCAEERQLVELCPAVNGLSPEERNVIGLAYFRACSQQEIAWISGLPLATVKSIMLHVQDKLRAGLAHAPVPGAASEFQSSSA